MSQIVHPEIDCEMLAESSCKSPSVPVSILSVSSEPTLSNGDTHMTALRSSSALSTSHPPTITSLIEEYLASRENPETSGTVF